MQTISHPQLPWFQQFTFAAFLLLMLATSSFVQGELIAGAAKVDITNRDAGPVNDPLHARALVISDDATTVVFVSLDVVAIGEIGSIRNDFLPNVRRQISDQLRIHPENIVINASHCHGVPCVDAEQRTVDVIRQAFANRVPVVAGSAKGTEERISENRRLRLKSGREVDVRHAYSLPPDEEVIGAGPVDPEIGVLRIDRKSGGPLAVLYNFACHPIQGVPSGGNTADITGFSSSVIEETLGKDTIALFFQGCGGDINPVTYKDVANPRDAEPLGNLLALSTLRVVRSISCTDAPTLKYISKNLELPRADLTDRIERLKQEQLAMLQSLRGTSLNLKMFLPLVVQYQLDPAHPSYYSHRYLREQQIGRNDLQRLDAENRSNMEAYIRNIHTMEELTRMQTNLNLLTKHQAQNIAAGKRTVDVEVSGTRLGNFRLLTFPGELTCQIGLNIKASATNSETFVSGYTNGYIYYCPTAEQMQNVGGAQEDSDCILAPEWQAIFEQEAARILTRLDN